MLFSKQISLLFTNIYLMKKNISFRVASIRHEGKFWKFYPCDCTVPIAFNNSLLNRERIPTAGKSCKMYIEVDDNAICSLRVDFHNLWELPKNADRKKAPILPEAYRITTSVCSRGKQKESDCCEQCPWCQFITPAGYMKLDYPSEYFAFRARTRK